MASTSAVTRTAFVQAKWGSSTLPRPSFIKKIPITDQETVTSFACKIYLLEGAPPFSQRMFISKKVEVDDNKLHFHSFCAMTHGSDLLAEHVADFSKVITVIERELGIETFRDSKRSPILSKADLDRISAYTRDEDDDAALSEEMTKLNREVDYDAIDASERLSLDERLSLEGVTLKVQVEI